MHLKNLARLFLLTFMLAIFLTKGCALLKSAPETAGFDWDIIAELIPAVINSDQLTAQERIDLLEKAKNATTDAAIIARIDREIARQKEKESSSTAPVVNPQPKPEQPMTELTQIPGAVYKVENGQRYQKHPSHDKWLKVDDKGNWIPISNRWLLKINSERDGKMVLLIPNNLKDKVEEAYINRIPGQTGSYHTNGGRGHEYYTRETTGPWDIRVTFTDGSPAYEKIIPAGSTRSDRPGEPGATWTD